MRATLLEPLGMERSTFDPGRIRETADRAIGHVAPMPDVTVDVPMAAAGGLYASASDLARFLGFQLGDGTIEGSASRDGRKAGGRVVGDSLIRPWSPRSWSSRASSPRGASSVGV